MNRFIAGALGGLIATVPMTIAMIALWKRLPKSEQYHLPPREIIEGIAARVSSEAGNLSEEQMAGISLAAHFAYGGVTGALYPAVCRKLRQPLFVGAGYGVGIWTASYLGWIPAAHILKPATQHPAVRNCMMIICHFIWGATTVLMGEYLRDTKGCNRCRQPESGSD